MANKEENVIAYLIKQANYVKLEKIITDCKISERSFYNYLKDIKENDEYILESNKNGFKLSLKNQKLSRKIPDDYEGRKTFLLRKGLIRQERLYMSSLMDYLAVSDSTFHSDLIKLRRELSKFHVRLISKDDELT